MSEWWNLCLVNVPVNGNPNLQGITFCSEGYWIPSLVFTILIFWGVDIVGTVARCFWCPFVFSKVPQRGVESEDKHNRTQISTKGLQDVFYKAIKFVTDRTIRAIAFRSGTGNVSLRMSTINYYNAIDFNTAFHKDSNWAFDTTESNKARNRRPFRLVCGSNEYLNLSLVIDNPFIPITTAQGDTYWFHTRKFSFSSSTSKKAIEERSRELTVDHPLRDKYITLLWVVGRQNWLPIIHGWLTFVAKVVYWKGFTIATTTL